MAKREGTQKPYRHLLFQWTAEGEAEHDSVSPRYFGLHGSVAYLITPISFIVLAQNALFSSQSFWVSALVL